MTSFSGDIAPPSTDLEGWKQAISEGRLRRFRLEDIAAAFQDLGHANKLVRERLAQRLSGAVTGYLRKRVDTNKPNRGEDIILEVHDSIFMALLDPECADGKMLRHGFGLIVGFRLKDALARSLKEQIVPAPKPKKKSAAVTGESKGEGAEPPFDQKTTEAIKEAIDDAAKRLGGMTRDEAREAPAEKKPAKKKRGDDRHIPYSVDEAEDDEIGPGKREIDTSLLDAVNAMNEDIDVARVLATIPDYKRRLAFRLFMDDVPYKNKKGFSIAMACGVSERTARAWIEQFEEELKQNKEAQELLRSKAGAKP
jgi:hypothetical protein